MNGPFRVAEVSGTTTTTNNAAPRIYTLTKPLGEQAVVVNLGYDQKVKVDFSSIANEKITLVHIGDKLIILFDNKSTLTVEPFFDSRHDGINNLSIEVAPGRDVSVSEFASLFPITTDQSILPAAGEGNGNAQASGADFSPSSVDPLGIGNPLALLGQEELGNFVVGQDTFDGTPGAAAPTIAVGAGLALTVDESFIPVVGSLQLPAGSTVAVADYSTVFAVTAPGGVASQTYALTATGTASNLIDTGTGQTVVLVQKGAGEVDGIVTIEGVAVTVFTLTVDAAGHVTMTDLRAVHEANPADSNDGISLAAGLVSLSVTVTDLNANVVTAAIDLGPNVTILDDGPTITAHEGEIPSLNVDESFLTAATNDGVAGSGTGPAGSTTDHGFFAGAFTSVAGADGATIAYKLGIGGTPSGEGGLIDSGLIDSSTGAHVVLVLTAGGVVEGHVGTAAGATVFTLTVDPATAEVTLTQFRSVHEGSPDSPDDTSEGISLDSVANLVTLTATITDGDGDKATASIDLGTRVTFHDDGPSISVVQPSEGDEGGSVPSLNVDESFLTAATNAGVDGSGTGPAGATTDHASFAGMFTSVQGADHATISYILGIAAPEEEATFLDSGLVDSATGLEVVLVLTPAGVVEGHVGTADGETVFTLTIDAATAEVTLTQLRSVHENTADNPTDSSEGISLDRIVNLVTLTAIIVDNDGDSASASIDIGAQITFHDDGPILSVTAGEGAAVVDETHGLQTASGATDVAFSSLSGAAQLFFNAVLNKGSDPDVSHDHGAIGYAVGAGLVTATVNSGADHLQSEVFALTLSGNGVDSGLATTEGREIYLFLENGVIVGRYDAPHDGNTTVNQSDPAAFAIVIDPATGDISIAQYVSLNHPDQATAADGFNSYNEAISLAPGTVSISVTVTDNDNDSVTQAADVSGAIKFLDDGPKVTVVVDRHFSVVLDETPGVQSQDDDTTSSSVRHLFDSVANTGNDPDLTSGQKDHGAIGFAIGNNAALDVTAVFGADGPSGQCTNVFSLTLNGISGSVDSGLQTTEGKEIYLTLENGVIVGRVDTDGDHHVTASDPAAFAIAIDNDGHVATAEYLSLHHGDPHADDESVQLASGTVSATVTITDGDGDTASASADISGKIQFEDDVPVARDVTAGTILDDEAQTLFTPVNFGGNGDVSPSVNTTSGGAGVLFDSGADGTKSVSFAEPSGLKAIYKLPSGLAGQESVHYTTTVSGDHTILTAIGDSSGNTVFTLNVGADGSYVFKVSEPLVDPVHSTTEENLSIKIGFTVTDGDGDKDTGSLTVKVNDDTPTVEVDQAQHDRHDVTLSTLTLDESIGAMAGDSNAASDDVPGVTTPTLLTSVDATKAIGIVSTPTSAHGTSVAELFETHVSFGADGPKAAAVSTYSFTLKDDHGNTVSNSHTGVETNLVVTELAGTALQGTSDAQRTVYLFQAADGSIVGRIGNNSNGDIALHVVITGSASDPQITVEQYLPIEHSNHGSSDESTALTFDDGDASLGINLTVTATDGDGDVATDSKTISLADCNTSLIKIEDDGPTVTITATAATVVHDETPGIQTAADPNAANDVHFSDLSITVQSAFTNVSNPGNQPDLITDHGAIGFAKSTSALVNVTADFGTDGHAINNAQVLALAIAGGNGVNSGLKTTDGHEIDLFLENGLIVGRYDGSDAGTTITNSPGHVDPAAFAIAISQDGTISLAQYVALFNPTPGSSYDEPTAGLKDILVTVKVTDGDGDTATSSVNISGQIQFQDDGPTVVAAPTNLISNGDFSLGTFAPASFGGIASAPGSVTGWVFSNSTVEAPAPGGLQVERVADGYLGLHSSTHGSMIDMAASPGNIQLSQQVSGLVSGQTYAVEFEAGAPYPATAELQVIWNNVVIGTIDPTGPMTSYSYVVTATGNPVNDQITFREVGLGHAPIPGEADEGYHGTYLANIAIVATNVVDEDGLSGPLSFGNNDSQVGDNVVANTDGDNNEATATGNLHINWGADNADKAVDTVTGTFATLVQDTPGGIGNRSVTFTDANVSFAGASSLTSQGVAITFSLNADHTVLTGSAGGRSVFEVSLSDEGTGSYRFVLLDQLDHAPNGNENDIALTFNYTVTDSDGDTAGSKFIVSVDDDVPVTGLNATITVDEDDLASGNHNTTSPGDDAASVSPVTGTLNFKVGADEPATVGFASLNGGAVVDAATHAVTAGGVALHYYWDSASHTLYASTSTDTLAHATATAAFKIEVTDPATGAYSFSLLGQVDHPGHNDGVGGTQTAYEDNININLTYTVTDRDNDTATGTLSVSIDDDIPVIGSGAATNNLIVNGSFEQGHDDLGNNQWSIYHTITGWSSKDIGPAGPAGDVPFELQTGNVGGVFAQNGNTLLELDSDLKSGDLPGGDHFNDSGHTNTIVQQVVAGTVADQSYELTFYYAPRPGEGDADSGSMDVLWNGTVVKTIDSTGMAPGVWQLITVSVVGTGPGDVLAFQGTGQENSYGAFIDNVSLVPVTFVDEDGLTGPLSKGNHDSQPGDNIVPDTDHDANEATSTGNLNIKWGADNIDSGTDTVAGLFGTLVQDHPDGVGDRSVTFTNTNVTVDGVSSLTSHGQAVTFSLNADGTMLTGVAGARTVMEISLSDEGSGAFRVVLLDQLDHAPGNNENDIFLTFNFTATDSDGDAVKSTFTVGVDDDVPVATGGSIFIGEVFEGGLGNSLAPTKVTFSGLALASMVSIGADEPGTIGLNGAVTGVVHDSTGHDVTSQGITVKYAAVGGDVIGFADTNGDNVFTSGEHEIFRLHDNGNGLLTFTLEDQVDGAGSSAGGGHPLILNLATAFKATDFDGDSTVLSGSVSFGVESGTSDPIVLDLGKSGLAFSSSANGVQFDINGDGTKDQVAWTANGEGGILALDVNGSGKIENGNELFTPGFAGGHFANGIAALASLDANHDGVIDSRDPAFSQLVVWQDANHNGVSDAGELTKLADLGIKSIDLATTADAGSIDGQHVAAAGTFTYVDGSKGSFAEVDFDTTLGTSSTPTGVANDTHSDLPKGGMDHVVDFTPTGHGELNFSAINPGVPAGGEQSHFSFVDAPLMHDTFGDNSAAAAKMALAILQAGGTVDTAHLPVAH